MSGPASAHGLYLRPARAHAGPVTPRPPRAEPSHGWSHVIGYANPGRGDHQSGLDDVEAWVAGL